jgi:AcrR family transcriptional regulator
MKPSKDTLQEKENLRQEILDTATILFVDRGYHGIGMREIAANAGVSKALLYYHFQNKEDLFLAILMESLEKIGDLVRLAQQPGKTTRQQIEIVFMGMTAWEPNQRVMIYVAKQEAKHLSESQRAEFMKTFHHNFIGQVQDIFANGIRRGEVQAVDPGLLSQILIGMVSPALSAAGTVNEVQGIMKKILELFFDGVQPK